MKYLIVECNELGDQYECDANRKPICMTDDCSTYGIGYEVYELQADNTFKLIKDYETALDEGMAVYEYDGKTGTASVIYEKYKDFDRDDITKTQITNWKNKYGFTDTVNNIHTHIRCYGCHSEEINGKYLTIGEYMDTQFYLTFFIKSKR